MEENMRVENVAKQENMVPVRVQTPAANPNVIVKDPGIAAVLSFFFTGLGQIYNGQIGKGLAFMLIQALNLLLLFVLIGFITVPLFWIYGIYDAHKVAKATHGL